MSDQINTIVEVLGVKITLHKLYCIQSHVQGMGINHYARKSALELLKVIEKEINLGLPPKLKKGI
jgi:hypothetical protein